jgi:long-chain fatty acid transport protein
MTIERHLRRTPLAVLASTLLAGAPAWATNGMNMEGYGPISTGMGGASQAIDHGTAAMAQNPATLALMPAGARLDVAVGLLGPDVRSRMPGMPTAKSSGTEYIMPALGYARRSGDLTYGIGVFAQGGMGTEYGANSFLAVGSGDPVRSELGVGRVMLPLAFQLTPSLAVGATLDFMWAGLDMRMAALASQLGGLVTGGSGNLAAGLAQTLPMLPPDAWARIDFSDGSDFTGEARSTGWAGKLGLVYQAGPSVTLGASYQFESSLGDMKTSSSGAALAVQGFPQAIPGRITVIDFQWPSMLAVGASWQATPALLLAADVKRIGWSGVMKDFRLRFDSKAAPFDGSVSFALPQNWRDQTVVNLGLAWAASPALTLRAGVNLSDNPIPEALVHPLFPATVERHVTGGIGYRFSPASDLNASLSIAPTSTVVNAMGVKVTHSQRSAQLMFSHRF